MQQMEPGDMNREQPALDYGGYEGNQPFNQSPQYAVPTSPASSNQGDMSDNYQGSQGKLQPERGGGVPAGMRLALAIVSVAMLGYVAINIVNSSTVSAGSYIILGIVALGVFLINAVFNRWWFSSWG